MHKELHALGQTFSKRDKLGLHATIENNCIELLALAVKAAFQPKKVKLETLELLRVRIEVLKHLIRTEQELVVLKEKSYLHLSGQLVEISKMTNGWIAYTQKESW